MATYHVKTTGNDGNVGSDASPWLTVSAHIANASAIKVSAGDTIEIHTGTYDWNIVAGSFGTDWITGTAGNPIRIIAHGHSPDTTKGNDISADAVVVRGTGGANIVAINKLNNGYYYFGGFTLDGTNMSATAGAVYLANDANNVEFRNMEFKQSKTHGLTIEEGIAKTNRAIQFNYCNIHNCGTDTSSGDTHGSYCRGSGVIFDHCNIENNRSSGIQIRANSDQAWNARNNIIRYCDIHGDNNGVDGKYGIAIHSYARGNIVHNNLIYDFQTTNTAGIGFTSGNAASGNLVYNNTIVDVAARGVWILYSSTTGTEIKNNLIFDCGTGLSSQIVNGGSGTISANNWLGHPSASSPYDDPFFTSYTANSTWTLTHTGSTPTEILTGGLDLGADYYDDFAGATRAAPFSIGAYAGGVAADPPEDPVLVYPTSLNFFLNTNAPLDVFGVIDTNDPDVGNYTVDVVVTEGVLNDGV